MSLFTVTGEQHGLIKTLANSVPEEDYSRFKPEDKAKLLKMRKEDSRKVKARYINYRGLNERCSPPYCKYAGDPITMWHFIPNYVYEVPMGLVNQINESPGLAERGERVDELMNPISPGASNPKIHEMIPISF